MHAGFEHPSSNHPKMVKVAAAIFCRREHAPMDEFVRYLGPIAILAVLIVLLLGLFNMMRAGSASRSQTLMRWRVGLQFAAVIILMLGLYLASR